MEQSAVLKLYFQQGRSQVSSWGDSMVGIPVARWFFFGHFSRWKPAETPVGRAFGDENEFF